MDIRIGCDLVYFPSFIASMQQGGDLFLQKIFTLHELAQAHSAQRLAGIFAIKEAVAKALGAVPPAWQHIEVSHVHGRPRVSVLEPLQVEGVIDVSVAHDGEYVMAHAIIARQ